MNLQDIVKRFSIISNLSLEEAFPWTQVCEEAAEEIRLHLKKGVDENEHHRRLDAAAASLAFYRYVLYRASGGGMESFTAGEIRIKTDAKTSVKMALAVWKDAKHSISDLLNDDEFIFETILQ